MAKVEYTACDICGKRIPDSGYVKDYVKCSVRDISDRKDPYYTVNYDLCPSCAKKIKAVLINTVNEIKGIGKESETKDKPKDVAVRPICDGYNSHDACRDYHCPICHYRFDGWKITNEISKHGNKCPLCGQLFDLENL